MQTSPPIATRIRNESSSVMYSAGFADESEIILEDTTLIGSEKNVPATIAVAICLKYNNNFQKISLKNNNNLRI